MEIAYIAGLFDGEGTVGIYRSGKYWSVRLAIVGTHKPMIESIYNYFNIGLFTTQKRQAIHNTPKGPVLGKQGWRWMITDRQGVKTVLEQLRPYLIEKADQVDIVLGYLNGDYEGETASRLCKEAKRFEFSVADFNEYAPRKNSFNNAGEKNASAKLNWKAVDEIREMAKSGITATDIANKYGVSKSAASRIIKNKTWIKS